ncbi:MAG: hypothetical protein EOO01_11305, partial [Chitinophagaceae bacterium]
MNISADHAEYIEDRLHGWFVLLFNLSKSILMNTKTNSIYRSFFIVAALSAVAYLFFTARGQHSTAGWLLVLFFLFLAIGFRSVKVLRGFSYTVCIIGAVCMAMYYPQYFSTIGDFKLSKLTIPLLQIIMFGMGTELSLKDF